MPLLQRIIKVARRCIASSALLAWMVAIVLEDDSNELEAGLRKQLEQGVDIVLIISGGLAPI